MIEHAQAAVEQHDRGREPADEQHTGSVRGGQALRPHVGAAVAVVEVLEDLLVARLAPEGVHGLDTAEALDEVHDHQGDCLAGGAVGPLSVPTEPARHDEEDREGGQRHESELQVEQQQGDADADDEQHGRDEREQSVAEQVGDGFDVGGLAGDDATRRVLLVERDRQTLEVHEQPAAGVEDDLLADPPEQQQECVERQRGDHGHRQHGHDHGDERTKVAAPALQQRGNAVVDALLDEPGHGQLARRAERDEQRGADDRRLVRSCEVGEQGAAAASEQAGETACDFFFLLGLHPPPGVDQRVAGDVEGDVGIDFVDVVEFGHDATSSTSSSWRASSLSSAR